MAPFWCVSINRTPFGQFGLPSRHFGNFELLLFATILVIVTAMADTASMGSGDFVMLRVAHDNVGCVGRMRATFKIFYP